MKKVLALIIALSMCVGIFAMTAAAADTNYTQNWNNAKSGSVSYTNGSGGNFSLTWSSNSGSGYNLVCGKGWSTGNASRKISYNAGTFKQTGTSGCSYLSLYGWTTNSLIEYYVMDSWVNYKPAEGTKLGTVSSDGGTYDVWKHQQVNQPSISGTQTFWQIFSLRQSQRTQGANNTITFANHVNGWKNLGFSLGSGWNYQMIAVEGYESSGQANVTVWES